MTCTERAPDIKIYKYLFPIMKAIRYSSDIYVLGSEDVYIDDVLALFLMHLHVLSITVWVQLMYISCMEYLIVYIVLLVNIISLTVLVERV